MPLPKPPAKRAALLSAEEFESQAAPRQPRKTPKSPAAAEPQAVTALYGTQSEPSAPVITRPPVLPPPPARHVHRHAGGKLLFQTQLLNVQLPVGLPQGKADNQILGVVQSLREQHGERDVVLVSKDINMRVKARALGLPAEDYFNDKTLEDGDLLYTGVLPLPADFWDKHAKGMESWQQGGITYYR